MWKESCLDGPGCLRDPSASGTIGTDAGASVLTERKYGREWFGVHLVPPLSLYQANCVASMASMVASMLASMVASMEWLKLKTSNLNSGDERVDGWTHKIREERADGLTFKIDGERADGLTRKINGERADGLTFKIDGDRADGWTDKMCEERADGWTCRIVVEQITTHWYSPSAAVKEK